VPSFTLPYREVNGYGGFGDVLLPIPAQDSQVIDAWKTYGAPAPAPAAAQPVPTTTPGGRGRPASTTPSSPPTSAPRPAWDPTAC